MANWDKFYSEKNWAKACYQDQPSEQWNSEKDDEDGDGNNDDDG